MGNKNKNTDGPSRKKKGGEWGKSMRFRTTEGGMLKRKTKPQSGEKSAKGGGGQNRKLVRR